MSLSCAKTSWGPSSRFSTQLILCHTAHKPITAVPVACVNRCEADDDCLVGAKELSYTDTNRVAQSSECSCRFMLPGMMRFLSNDLLKHVDPGWQESNAMISQLWFAEIIRL